MDIFECSLIIDGINKGERYTNYRIDTKKAFRHHDEMPQTHLSTNQRKKSFLY